MLGLLGVGVALMAGVAVRIAAISGGLLLAVMWLATFPLAQFDSTGAATSSTNPFIDEHVTEALVLLVLALTYAGIYLGAGTYLGPSALRQPPPLGPVSHGRSHRGTR